MTDTDDEMKARIAQYHSETTEERIARRFEEEAKKEQLGYHTHPRPSGGWTPNMTNETISRVMTEEIERLRKEIKEDIAQAKKEAISCIPPQDPMFMRLD